MSTSERKKPQRQITQLERRFADNILDGMKPSAAYRKASGSKGTCQTATREAVRLGKRPLVIEYIAKGRAVLEDRSAWSREQMLATLRSIADEPTAAKSARISAITQASKMLGFDAPQKIEGVAGGQPITVKWMS